MEDLEPDVLSHTIDCVYRAFICSDHAQQIQNLPEEILFSLFMTTNAFEIEITQEDDGYESGNENFCIPTSLSRALGVYHVSTVDDFFNLANVDQSPIPPDQHAEASHHRHRCHNLTHCCLVFTSSNDESPVRSSE